MCILNDTSECGRKGKVRPSFSIKVIAAVHPFTL